MSARTTNPTAAISAMVSMIMAMSTTAIADGATILILTDWASTAEMAPIPSLLSTAAVHHHLIREKTRTQVGLVVETGEAREIHHFCLLLGFGAAFAIEFIDDTIKNPDDLTNKLKVTPLGVIPKGPKDMTLIEVLSDPRAPVTEAYHSVRTALQFASDHGVPKTLLVTSTRAAEGKSSTSMALAQNFARLGASVLLIDSDLRKPSFRAPSSASEGLSNLLAGAQNIRECIHKTNFDRLFLLPSGPIPPNPAELLSTGRFRDILNEVGGWFDYVVVDAPPVLGLDDVLALDARARREARRMAARHAAA